MEVCDRSMFELCHLTRIHVAPFIKNLGRWMVTRALIGIDGISGEIKYDPGLGEVAVLEWGLRRS